MSNGSVSMDVYYQPFDDDTPVTPRTGPQVGGTTALSNAELANLYSKNYKTYLEMRSDPTIAFGRMLCVAPLVIAGWAYEEEDNAPPGARDFIQDQLEPWRILLMKSAIEGYVDFGFQPYEVVYRVDDQGFIALKKVKPLLQERTLILVDVKTGEYIGLRQQPSAFLQILNPG